MSNQIIIEDKSQNYTLTVKQPTTQVIEVIGKGPKRDKGDSIFNPNEGGSYSTTSSLEVIGSLTVTQGITGSLQGTATTATTLQTPRTLTIGNTGKLFDGSGNVRWSLAEIGAQSILTNPITGTGTTNYIPKFTSNGTIGNSIVYDNGTNVGIGTTSLSEKLEVDGKVLATGFKTSTGTATQALTANGSTFDLTTKLDKGGYEGTAQDLKNDLNDTIKDVSSKVNYRVEIISTNGNLFKNDFIETTLIARVYFGSKDITDSLPQNSFRWKRVSSDSDSDNAWNRLHQDFGSNILSISSIDVENRAVFNCEVTI